MKESGQIDRILRKWMPKPRSDCGYNGEFVSMGLDNMISAFAMVAVGIILAIVSLLFEIGFRIRKAGIISSYEAQDLDDVRY